MKRKSIFISAGLRVGAVLLVGTAVGLRVGWSQNGGASPVPFTISVSGHRPLVDALDQLQQKTLKPVNFEEAPYESPVDVGTHAVQTLAGLKQISFPTGGGFSATFSGDDAYSTAQAAVASYTAAGLSGTYRARQNGSHIDVVPVNMLTADNSPVSLSPVMDTIVNFPVASRSVLDTLQLVVDTMSQVSGRTVLLAAAPIGPNPMVKIGADKETAESAIFDLFAQLSPAPIYFRMLYDPTSRAYYLSIRGVPASIGNQIQPQAARPQPVPPQPAGNNAFFKKAN